MSSLNLLISSVLPLSYLSPSSAITLMFSSSVSLFS
jgi:hypothetical protein